MELNLLMNAVDWEPHDYLNSLLEFMECISDFIILGLGVLNKAKKLR